MDESKLEGITRINDMEFEYHNSHGFKIAIPEKMGSEQAVYYDVESLKKSCEIIRNENIKNAIVYIMACRIGVVIKKYA